MTFSVNYLAILVAALVNMAVGFVWYGPLFGKTWMKLVGISKEDIAAQKSKLPMLYGGMFLVTLIFVYVMAHFVQIGGAATAVDGSLIGFWAWFGFVATTSLGGYTFSGRPLKLWKLENGHHLINFLITGALLAVWQ